MKDQTKIQENNVDDIDEVEVEGHQDAARNYIMDRLACVPVIPAWFRFRRPKSSCRWEEIIARFQRVPRKPAYLSLSPYCLQVLDAVFGLILLKSRGRYIVAKQRFVSNSRTKRLYTEMLSLS
jgi:hypothetical protein